MKTYKNILRAMRWHLAALLGCVAVFETRGADLDSTLDRWCAAQTNIQTWSAELTQTRSLKVLAQPLVSTGKLWVAMPNRFRWELGAPAQTIALRQPNQLVLIYPRLKRAEKYPLDGAQAGPWKDALALLDASFPQSRAQLESRFQVMSINQTNAIVYLALQPKSASARKFMTAIHVSFNTNDFLPLATELKFADGSSMRNDFTHSVLNAPASESLFEMNLTPDFTVIEPLRP
jgi:outer membrane lipoprotein-sorting protein